MPGGDKTGPSGMGPMTGRGVGFCAGSNAPGYMNSGFGRGRGMGGGGGRGRRNQFLATGQPGWMRSNPAVPVADTQKDALQDQLESLQNQLSEIQEKLDKFEKDKKD
jgi:uncharacterized protein DUF5320